MIELNVYSIKGVKKPKVTLPHDLEVKASKVLLAQAIRVYTDRLHPGLAKVKTRGEVSYSTRKIYRQKGTGGARHGGRGAPIFVGGGVAHGPTGVKRELRLPKKLAQKAFKLALSLKARDGEVVVVDGLSSLKKTKDAFNLINKIRAGQGVRATKFTFAISEGSRAVRLTLRNLGNVETLPFKDINAYKVFYGGVLVIDKEALGTEKKTKKSGIVQKKSAKSVQKSV